MKRITLCLLAVISAQAGPARAADGEWAPDQGLIAKIEKTFAPAMASGLTDIGGHSVKALAPLNHYSRYYAGETVKGEKVVVGSFVYGTTDAVPDSHVVSMKELPRISGGGCGVIMIWFHVDSGKIESVCNFPM